MKTLWIFALLSLSAGLFAQSLEQNEYYRKAVELAGQSQAAMDAASYDAAAKYAIESQKYAALSRQYIEQALEALQNPSALAAEYEVKLNPANRDCLWRIAGFNFIYGDSREWKRIYDYNRSTFRRPDNPNLIYPGQILKIPSINGEAREGRR
ncbi:MAG: LysM peptidoglycan-binding domain-containing protein [Spirochaetaceae bacterium]|jgi:nucleoid-associated protein YgaU|nr:LysM peptidoglycan-binding domain-containing protein [Spirochaetaceae bacterium]